MAQRFDSIFYPVFPAISHLTFFTLMEHDLKAYLFYNTTVHFKASFNLIGWVRVNLGCTLLGQRCIGAYSCV